MSYLFCFKRSGRPADPKWNAVQYGVEAVCVVGVVIALPGILIAAPGLIIILLAQGWWDWMCGDF